MTRRLQFVCVCIVLALATLVTATPAPTQVKRGPATTVANTPAPTATAVFSCAAPDVLLCCNSVQAPNAPSTLALLGLLGISDSDGGLVGFSCAPPASVAGGCTVAPVCCEHQYGSGFVATGCIPFVPAA